MNVNHYTLLIKYALNQSKLKQSQAILLNIIDEYFYIKHIY